MQIGPCVTQFHPDVGDYLNKLTMVDCEQCLEKFFVSVQENSVEIDGCRIFGRVVVLSLCRHLLFTTKDNDQLRIMRIRPGKLGLLGLKL